MKFSSWVSGRDDTRERAQAKLQSGPSKEHARRDDVPTHVALRRP